MHFLSDVLAGVVMGVALGLCFDHGFASLGLNLAASRFACLPAPASQTCFSEEFETGETIHHISLSVVSHK